MKKLSDLVENEVGKNTKFNTLKAKVHNSKINQCNADKKNLEKKIGDNDKKMPDRVIYWVQPFCIPKLIKLRTKYQILVVQWL